jgi:hypothetical protein
MDLPMAQREGKTQKCKGKFGSLTQIGAKVKVSIIGSKEGVQGFMHKLELPQNQDL